MEQSMYNFYLVRHGKTLLNTTGRVQGWADSPLTGEGQENVHLLGKSIPSLPWSFDRIYSGNSGRHIETTNILQQYMKNESPHYTQLAGLREINFGSFEGELETEMEKKILEKLGKNSFDEAMKAGFTYKDIPDVVAKIDEYNFAETTEQATKRIQDAWEIVQKEVFVEQAKNVLLVSSSLTISVLLGLIDSTLNMDREVENASVTHIQRIGDEYSIQRLNEKTFQ